MTHKKKYIAPVLFEEIMLEMEGGILAATPVVTKDTEVVSTGQEIKEIGMTEFNHNWE